MADGFTFINGYTGESYCYAGIDRAAACKTAGGAYWDWNGNGQFVCSVYGTTIDMNATDSVPCNTQQVGVSPMKSLSYSEANTLFAAIVVVVGLAWIINQSIRFVLNR